MKPGLAAISATLLAGCTSSSEAAFRRAMWVAGLLAAVTTLATLVAGAPVQTRFGHDDFVLLEGAWKVLHGARPHVDFYTPFGAFNFLLFAAGLQLAGPSASALGVANALFAALVFPLAWFTGRSRLSATFCALFVLLVFFLAASTRLLRFPVDEISYAMIYNRHGYALCAVLLVVLLLPAHGLSHRGGAAEGSVAGALIVLLAFIKISYFLVALGLIGTALMTNRRPGRWWRWALTGSGSIVLIFTIYLSGDLAAMWRDLQTAAAARVGLLTAESVWSSIRECLGPTLLVLVIAGVGIACGPRPGIREVFRGGLRLAAVVIGSVLLLMTNSPLGPHGDLPLLGVGALGAAQIALPRMAAAHWIARIAVTALALAAAIATLMPDVVSTALAVESARSHDALPRIEAPALRDLFITGFGGDPPMPATYAAKLNDGLALLRRSAPAGARVESFDFTNPFPFALQWPPNPGGAVAWQLHFTFSQSAHPPAAQILGRADAVMLPKHPADLPTLQALLAIYGGELRAHFRLAGESPHWILFLRP